MKKGDFAMALALTLTAFSSSAGAATDYYNQKWFDYPDPFTVPKVEQTGCGKQACTKIPEFHGIKVTFKEQCACINPLMKTELLRHDVNVTVTGPESADDAVKKAVEGYVAGCVATAIAASTAGPQVIASPAGFFGAFQACISAISAAGVAGGILNQVNIHLDTNSTHWAPL
jgi:hypothetical protein